MEQDKKKKRAREGDHQHHHLQDVSNSKRHAKKKDGLEDHREDSERKKTSLEEEEEDLSPGVFDFPWLKDGVVWKTEEWRLFEDAFSSPLFDETANVDFEFSSISGQVGLCGSPEALLELPEQDKFEETETVDCIWSSLLNQPLQQPN